MIKDIVKQVRKILEESAYDWSESPRNNDSMLCVRIWEKELCRYYNMPMTEENLRSISWPGFVECFTRRRDVLTRPETIRRCRQRLQELHPNLRGSAWHKRHEKAERVRTAALEEDVHRLMRNVGGGRYDKEIREGGMYAD